MPALDAARRELDMLLTDLLELWCDYPEWPTVGRIIDRARELSVLITGSWIDDSGLNFSYHTTVPLGGCTAYSKAVCYWSMGKLAMTSGGWPVFYTIPRIFDVSILWCRDCTTPLWLSYYAEAYETQQCDWPTIEEDDMATGRIQMAMWHLKRIESITVATDRVCGNCGIVAGVSVGLSPDGVTDEYLTRGENR